MQSSVLSEFLFLVEATVLEASAVITAFDGIPHAQQLAAALHRNAKLSHLATVTKKGTLRGKQLLDLFQNLSESGSVHMVFLIKGQTVFAVLVSKTTDQFYFINQKGKLVKNALSTNHWRYRENLKLTLSNLDLFKSDVDVYIVEKPNAYVTTIRKKRSKIKNTVSNEFTSQKKFAEQLVKKFKPLWIKSLESAKADLKGYINLQIKNNSYSTLYKKIERLHQIDEVLSNLEFNPSDTSISLITTAMHDAVSLAAYHYYPELAKNISSDNWRSNAITTHKNAIEQLFNDITNGDINKLGTVLGFFKRTLIRAK